MSSERRMERTQGLDHEGSPQQRTTESHEFLSPGRYSIRTTSDKGQFFRITKQGDIYNEKELDREVYPWYNLTVEAKELDSSGEWSQMLGDLGFSPLPHSFKIGIICHFGALGVS